MERNLTWDGDYLKAIRFIALINTEVKVRVYGKKLILTYENTREVLLVGDSIDILEGEIIVEETLISNEQKALLESWGYTTI